MTYFSFSHRLFQEARLAHMAPETPNREVPKPKDMKTLDAGEAELRRQNPEQKDKKTEGDNRNQTEKEKQAEKLKTTAERNEYTKMRVTEAVSKADARGTEMRTREVVAEKQANAAIRDAKSEAEKKPEQLVKEQKQIRPNETAETGTKIA